MLIGMGYCTLKLTTFRIGLLCRLACPWSLALFLWKLCIEVKTVFIPGWKICSLLLELEILTKVSMRINFLLEPASNGT